MAQKKNPLKKAKILVRPSPASLKIILIILILFSMVALVALRWVHNGILEETDHLLDEAAAIEHANSQLEEKTADLGSVQSVKDIAREELGLEDPNSVIIEPIS